MYACIDLGSNSFHLLIAEWLDDEIQLVERCSEKVQLGEGVLTTGQISPVAFTRGLECLERFKSLVSAHGVNRYWALGTNTFRVAENASDFVQAAGELGVKISIVSGVQEAVLIYSGVISALPENDDVRLVIDIGGGSTELIVGQRDSRLITHSLPMGCIAWRDTYFADQQSDLKALADNLEKATLAASEAFLGSAPAFSKYHWVAAFASSGTAKMLTAICQEQGLGLNKAQLTLSALQQVRDTLLQTIADGTELTGLKEKRRDLLLPGYAVLMGLMQSLGVDSITFSPTALREGMLDFMVHNRVSKGTLVDDNLPEVSYAGS
jgi:exopolyphosphatase/guanosine-5'-triphosphate,3'-diphosphate pyrophosphatase